jgi:type II secretory pathway component GspD/PulD (secretin)
MMSVLLLAALAVPASLAQGDATGTAAGETAGSNVGTTGGGVNRLQYTPDFKTPSTGQISQPSGSPKMAAGTANSASRKSSNFVPASNRLRGNPQSFQGNSVGSATSDQSDNLGPSTQRDQSIPSPSTAAPAISAKNPARAPQTDKSVADKLAQYYPGGSDPGRKGSIPGIVGTVKIRKAFKLFAQQQLIHNLSFRDTPVREVIAEVARRGNLNIIIDKSVQGKITGELRDVTLNEAMDSVLAAAGLQSRVLDNSTVIIGSTQAMVQLGLNRPMARAFKLSYAHPYDVAIILFASVFNKGMVPDFNSRFTVKTQNNSTEQPFSRVERGGGAEGEVSGTRVTAQIADTNEQENSQLNRPDVQRIVRGSSRSQTQEGVGYNNAAVDPGTQQVRSFQEINTDYIVDQNGGGAVVIPDVKNRQVIVVGTQDDIAIAEESIRLLDRRPREVHIQTSLVELTNQGIRELGATLNLQGLGASGSIMGNAAAPLVNYLPGLGSPPAYTFNAQGVPTASNQSAVTPTSPGTAFTGLLGNLLPLAPTIAGVTGVNPSQSSFNFLTLSKGAGGSNNIATYPYGLNVALNLLLQTNKAKIIANPSVVVVDGTEALVTIASEVVHKVTSTVSLGVVTTNVELTKAGIFLNVLPKVTEDGFITMRLRPQVSTPLGPPQQFGSSASPTVVTLLNIRDIIAQEVRVKDGQTLVLGGLFTEQEEAQLSKVPYLAEAPVLGALFRNSLKGRNRSELMLLITPKTVEEDPASVSETPASPTM